MYCTNCGTQNPENARFCSACGEPLERLEDEANQTSAPQPEPHKEPRKRTRAAAFAIIAVLLAGAGLSARLLLSSPNISINERSFPDEMLRSQVAMAADLDGDGQLSPDEIASLRTFRVTGARSLVGLGLLTNLQELTVAETDAEELSLSGQQALESIVVEDAPALRHATIEGCPELKTADFSGASELDDLILPADNSVSELLVPQSAEVTNLSEDTEVQWDNYMAYASKLRTLIEQYGAPRLYSASGGSGFAAAEGVCIADLVDFDGDGSDELLVGYYDNALHVHPKSSMHEDAYVIEVWSHVDGDVKVIYHDNPNYTEGPLYHVIRLDRSGSESGGNCIVSLNHGVATLRYELYEYGQTAMQVSHYYDVIWNDTQRTWDTSVDGVSTTESADEWLSSYDGKLVYYNLSDYSSGLAGNTTAFGDTVLGSNCYSVEDCIAHTEETLTSFGLQDVISASLAKPDTISLEQAQTIYQPVIDAVAADDGSGYAWGTIEKPTHFTIDDIDRDGIPELLFGYAGTSHTVVGIWTLDASNEPIDLAEGWSRSSYHILDDGRIHHHGSGGMVTGIDEVYRISRSGAPTLEERVVWEWDYLDGADEYSYTNLDEGITDSSDTEAGNAYRDSLVRRDDFDWYEL